MTSCKEPVYRRLIFSMFSFLFFFFFFSTVLSVNLDFNSKLQGLVNELRGEIGGALRGSKDAKERLLRSEYANKFIFVLLLPF